MKTCAALVRDGSQSIRYVDGVLETSGNNFVLAICDHEFIENLSNYVPTPIYPKQEVLEYVHRSVLNFPGFASLTASLESER